MELTGGAAAPREQPLPAQGWVLQSRPRGVQALWCVAGLLALLQLPRVPGSLLEATLMSQ